MSVIPVRLAAGSLATLGRAPGKVAEPVTGGRLELFVVVKGHAFSRDAFEEMLRAVGVEPTMVDQPAAAMLLNPDAMRRFDAILFYDMPGLDFRTPIDERPVFVEPDPAFRAGFEALLAEGKGMVALHHAIAGWPAWPAYARALGGGFLYKPATVGGEARLESRYAPDISYRVRSAGNSHPVLAGVPEQFDLTDELYLHEIFDDGTLVPLIHLDSELPADRFLSAMRAVRHMLQDESKRSPERRQLLGWAKATGASPLVYLQPGDCPATYANSHYRKLVGNAIRWVASPEALAWAAGRASTIFDGRS